MKQSTKNWLMEWVVWRVVYGIFAVLCGIALVCIVKGNDPKTVFVPWEMMVVISLLAALPNVICGSDLDRHGHTGLWRKSLIFHICMWLGVWIGGALFF
jgi:hypothetical protein